MKQIPIFCFLLLVSMATSGYHDNDSGAECTLDMFGGEVHSYWACKAQYALQQNWWPSPISGLFSYQVWNGFDGFWQNGAVLEVLANFMHYGNNSRYISVVKSSIREMYSLLLAYAPQPSYDDMGWYGLGYLRIYEVLGDPQFLQRAHDIYDWSWTNGWDHSGACAGGFWFDQLMSFKATITNVQMLQLGAKLYRLTTPKNQTILSMVNKTWNFIVKNSLIDAQTSLIADGIFLNNCTSNRVFGPTYNNGVLIGALVEYAHILNETGFIKLAHQIANATIALKSVNGILTEFCDAIPGVRNQTCDDDAKMFKGLFVRNLRYLMDVSTPEMNERYKAWLNLNMWSVLKRSSCEDVANHKACNISSRDGCKDVDNHKACNISYRDGRPFHNSTTPVFSENWSGPFNFSAPMQHTSAFELMIANIAPGTKCRGVGCAYDPPTPPPRPLTCADNPCPAGEDCCEYDGYYTCCAPDQKCVKGYCQ